MAPNDTLVSGELTAAVVCPNQAMAQRLTGALSGAGLIRVVAEFNAYPAPQQLDSRLRQAAPDIVLLDLGSDTETAVSLVSMISAMRPSIYVVGVAENSDAGVIIRSLRAGATEFLSSPFDPESQQTVATRILRLRDSVQRDTPERGKVLAFVGAKAGQGATTIALNVAATLAQEAKRKVALIDFDLLGGTASFSWRLNHSYSVVDALRHAEKLDATLWSALISHRNDVDVLLAPERPEEFHGEGHSYHEVVEFARMSYQIVVLDLPTPYGQLAQTLLGDADRIYVCCNPELPSLHLTRKCLAQMEHQGFTRDQISLLVNRMSRRQELSQQDMEKVFSFPIARFFPEDTGAVHRALTAGRPVPPSCELGRGLRDFSLGIFGFEKKEEKKGSFSPLKLSALLSQS